MKIKLILSALMLAALIGCSSSPPLVRPGEGVVTPVANEALPEPGRSDMVGNGRPYIIGPFDKLAIDVYGIAELSGRQYQADSRGQFSFPLVGTVDATGKTPAELSDLIATRLRAQSVRDPKVSVNLLETVNQVVTIDGAVREPGVYPVTGDMSLMKAIARAKGLSDMAKPENVIVFRSVNGKRYAGLYNLKAIRMGAYVDPEVYPGDIVVAGESGTRRFLQTLAQNASLFTTPLILLLQ